MNKHAPFAIMLACKKNLIAHKINEFTQLCGVRIVFIFISQKQGSSDLLLKYFRNIFIKKNHFYCKFFDND